MDEVNATMVGGPADGRRIIVRHSGDHCWPGERFSQHIYVRAVTDGNEALFAIEGREGEYQQRWGFCCQGRPEETPRIEAMMRHSWERKHATDAPALPEPWVWAAVPYDSPFHSHAYSIEPRCREILPKDAVVLSAGVPHDVQA